MPRRIKKAKAAKKVKKVKTKKLKEIKKAAKAYTITGRIEITNDCDRNLASLPAQVRVIAFLSDARRRAVWGYDTVRLAPDPAAPPGTPRKVGTYTIKVQWETGLGSPTHWDGIAARLPGGGDICHAIPCSRTIPGPTAGTRCIDTATRPRDVRFVNPTTTYDIRIHCYCIQTE